MEAGTKQKARHTQGPTARYKEGRKDMVGWCAGPPLGQDARYQLRAAGAYQEAVQCIVHSAAIVHSAMHSA